MAALAAAQGPEAIFLCSIEFPISDRLAPVSVQSFADGRQAER
jgi:hypothetical protein